MSPGLSGPPPAPLGRGAAWLQRVAWAGTATRVAVPGPVWGERPVRLEADEDPTPRRSAPRRGAWAGPGAAAPQRWVGIDAASLAQHAWARAAPLRAAPPTPAHHEAIRAQLAQHGLMPATLVDALAVVGAELAHHTHWVARPNQYHCAVLLLEQRLAELDTGEGKTVALALAAAVAAWAGAPVHALTANTYLAQRDAAALAPFYSALGLSVAAVAESEDESTRRRAWCADIVYASARTLGFDVLRDDAGLSAAPLLSRGLCVALVDEADSVLVDEARTPLVMAEARPDPHERVRAWRALDWARRLAAGHDAVFLPGTRQAHLTERGRARLAEMVAAERAGVVFYGARHQIEWVEYAWAALHGLQRDVDYMVQARAIVLIDASTGRPDAGRQLPRALHAMVAIKEGVPVPPATEVRANLTYPRLFARYHHLCGTSGTLAEAAAELRRHYGLVVARVPRTRPVRLKVYPMRVFATRDAQFAAASARAQAVAARGRSVLLATDSVADSTALAACLARLGTPVAVLDARHDGAEAALVARAGEPGRITVSTQMAGRGTDIALDPAVARRGGLHVLILQHNRSRRIDRQVAGRAARQGDPGSVEHWLRWQDSPLDPARLPGGLRHLVQVLRRGVARLPATLGAPSLSWVWRIYQWCWRIEDGGLRHSSLAQDRHWSRRLHFARIRPGHKSR